MKFTITKYLNKISLVKFFREEIPNLSLQEALYYAENLPYSWDDLSKFSADHLKEKVKGFAEYVMEDDPEDMYYNININPPPEFTTAMELYNTLSDENKAHVDQIALWRNRPAVC
jgi:hypothetical protein